MQCWSRAASRLAGAALVVCAAVAGCAKKDPSPADQRRSDVDDLADGKGTPADAALLAAILVDPKEDELVRGRAATALGTMPAGAAHSIALADAIVDESAIVRRDAIEACGRLGLTPVVPLIVTRLKTDPDVAVRRAAAVALGQLKVDPAVDSLLSAVSDRDAGVQMLAVEALQAITGQKLGRDADAWAKWAAERPR